MKYSSYQIYKWSEDFFNFPFFSPASSLATQRAPEGTAPCATYPYSWPEMEASAWARAGCWVSGGCWPWGCGSCLPAPAGSWRRPWARRSPSPREPGCPTLQRPWRAEGHCHQSFLHKSQTLRYQHMIRMALTLLLPEELHFQQYQSSSFTQSTLYHHSCPSRCAKLQNNAWCCLGKGLETVIHLTGGRPFYHFRNAAQSKCSHM